MKNLFFTYNPNPGGEVKIFELGDDIPQGNQQIVTFSYDSGFLPPKVLRGEIVQTFVQIYTGRSDVYEQDPQIDSIAIEWGFGEEIKAAKKYKNEARSQKRTCPSVIRKRVIASSIQQSPVLIMKEEKGVEKRVCELTKSVTSIGRHPGNDIVLKAPYVSNHHAKICQEDDGYFVYDCASKNGTRVNGQKIHRKKIADVDILELGGSTFVFISSRYADPR